MRKQRIESEQKRRDDLRDGYQRLKEILPASSQKSSKVVLLERGKHYSQLVSFNPRFTGRIQPQIRSNTSIPSKVNLNGDSKRPRTKCAAFVASTTHLWSRGPCSRRWPRWQRSDFQHALSAVSSRKPPLSRCSVSLSMDSSALYHNRIPIPIPSHS